MILTIIVLMVVWTWMISLLIGWGNAIILTVLYILGSALTLKLMKIHNTKYTESSYKYVNKDDVIALSTLSWIAIAVLLLLYTESKINDNEKFKKLTEKTKRYFGL